jgi:hypothetical protein
MAYLKTTVISVLCDYCKKAKQDVPVADKSQRIKPVKDFVKLHGWKFYGSLVKCPICQHNEKTKVRTPEAAYE